MMGGMMDVLWKLIYYGAGVIALAVVSFLGVAETFDLRPGKNWRHRTIAFTAWASGMTILYFAFQAGHQQGEWLAGVLLAILAVVVFGVVMFGGLLLFTKIHWQ